MKTKFVVATALLTASLTLTPLLAEADDGLPASACTKANADAAGGTFVPLPGKDWHYVVSDTTQGATFNEWKNLDAAEGGAGTQHGDKYSGVKPSTATCTPTDANGKTAKTFSIAVGGAPAAFVQRDVVCIGSAAVGGYTGTCG